MMVYRELCGVPQMNTCIVFEDIEVGEQYEREQLEKYKTDQLYDIRHIMVEVKS